MRTKLVALVLSAVLFLPCIVHAEEVEIKLTEVVGVSALPDSNDEQVYYMNTINDETFGYRSFEYIVARYADYTFPNPQYGFINASWSITNGHVENDIH